MNLIGRANTWKLRTVTLEFGKTPTLMGIVNVTPDSFSDGGQFFDPARAIRHGLSLVNEGAAILDVGGESTRPYSTPVDEDEERRRIVPVVKALVRESGVPISIDTSKASVAKAALDLGAEIINDVTGLEGDERMPQVALENEAGVCAMHMQGTPQTMQDDPRYDDIVGEIFLYLRARKEALTRLGILAERICLDPGIGFGKTHEHNLTLVANCDRFHDLGVPILAGYSRKGFIGKVLGDKATDRIYGNLGVAAALMNHGIQILRVHDVKATKEMLALYSACGAALNWN